MSYARKALKGASIVIILNVLASLIAYILRIVLARSLSPAEYGLFYAVFTFIAFLLFFRDLGLGAALVKFIAEQQVHKAYGKMKSAVLSVLSLQAASSLFFIGAILLGTNYLTVHYFKSSDARVILYILLIYFLAIVLLRLLKSIFHGLQELFLFTLADFVKNLLILLFVLLFFWQGMTLLAAPLAYALALLVTFFLFLPIAYKKFPFFKYKTTGFKVTSKQLLLFGIPMFALTLGYKFVGYIDTLVLTYFRSLVEVGIYNAVLPTAFLFLLIGNALAVVVFPLAAELWARKDTARLAKGMSILHHYLFALLLPVLGTVLIFANFFIGLFFGNDYVSGELPFQILIVGMFLFSLAIVNIHVISGIGYPKQGAMLVIIAAVVNLVLNLVLVPSFGMVGAAFGTTISFLLVLLLSTRKVAGHLEQSLSLGSWARLLIPGIGFFLIALYLQRALHFSAWIELLIVGVLASLGYVLLAYLFGAISIKEIKKYVKLVKE